MAGNVQPDSRAMAQLLARRWQEERPYFTLYGNPQGVGLRSSSLPRGVDGGLDLQWSRASAGPLPAATAARRAFADTSGCGSNRDAFLTVLWPTTSAPASAFVHVLSILTGVTSCDPR
jgi:hypothetical protein